MESSAQLKPSSGPSKGHTAASPAIPEEDKLRLQLQLHPEDATAHKRLIDILRKKNAFRAIVTEDAEWVKNNPTDFVTLIELTSFSTAALNDPEFSIVQMRSFLDRASRKDNPEYYDNLKDQLAGELEKRGRTDQALPLFADLLQLNPKEAGFWVDYGDALSALGRHSEAIEALHRAIELDPSVDVSHEALAEALLRSGNLSETETEYRAALSLYDTLYKKGEAADAGQSFMRQIIKTQAANHEEGYLAETHLKLAHVLLLDKKYDEAVAQTSAALEADQYEFAAFYLRAQVYDAKGKHTEATKIRDDANSAVRKEADKEGLRSKNKTLIDPRVLFLSDTLWNEKSGYPAFPLEIESILEPRVAGLSTAERVSLAMAYFAQGRVSDANQQWEKAIASDSTADNAVGHANLGRQLLKAGAISDALTHLRRAYELDPQNLTYRIDYEVAGETLKKK